LPKQRKETPYKLKKSPRMRFYKFPKCFKRFYAGAVWDYFSSNEKIIYLTFDDGPNPASTEWILNLLNEHNAKATFFCLGKNVAQQPEIFSKIKSAGHSIGNHGMNHLSGYNTSLNDYVSDLKESQKIIESKLFRPAYGRISPAQFRAVKNLGYKIIFWSWLTYDFDATLNSETRKNLILKNTKHGSIFVFHDSSKALPQLKNELPELMKEWIELGYRFEPIQE